MAFSPGLFMLSIVLGVVAALILGGIIDVDKWIGWVCVVLFFLLFVFASVKK